MEKNGEAPEVRVTATGRSSLALVVEGVCVCARAVYVCASVYVCMYVCMCVCVYLYVCVYVCTCRAVCVESLALVVEGVCVRARVRERACVCVRVLISDHLSFIY